MSDYEAFGHLRKQLPDWWITVHRDPEYPVRLGIRLVACRQDGATHHFVVPRAIICQLAGRNTLKDDDAEKVWRDVEDAFMAAARRVFSQSANERSKLGIGDIEPT